MSIRRVVPNIPTSRLDESRQFYTDLLGFEVGMDMPLGAGRILTLVSPTNPTAQLSLLASPESTVQSHQLTLSIEVAAADSLHARAIANGVPIVYPLTTEPWGVRRFHVADPNGIVINVMTHKE